MVWGMPRGGLESLLVDIANAQSPRHQVQIVIVNDDCNAELLQELDASVCVTRVGRPRGSRNPWYFAKCQRAVRRFAPDVIHIHQLPLIAYVLLLGAPKIGTVHALDVPNTRWIYKYSNLCCVSTAVLEASRARYPGIQSCLVPNGIVPEKVTVKASRSADRFRVVQLGRLDHASKGQDIAMRAIARIAAVRPDVRFSLDFIGSGPSRNFLGHLAREIGMETMVNFLGEKSRSEIYAQLAEYDLLLQPSRNEAFGLTIVEAMCARVPVLVSDAMGPCEIIENGEYGGVFRHHSPENCADEIDRVLQTRDSREFLERLSAAREAAIKRYSVSGTVERYDAVYLAARASEEFSRAVHN